MKMMTKTTRRIIFVVYDWGEEWTTPFEITMGVVGYGIQGERVFLLLYLSTIKILPPSTVGDLTA